MPGKWMTCLLIVLVASPALAIDYIAEREAAVELLDDGAYEQALGQFKALAQADISPAQKTDALELAVTCLLHLDRSDEATALTEQMPIDAAAEASRLRIMASEEEHEELFATSQSAAIASWPDYLKAGAYRRRAAAADELGHTERALADYRQALAWTYSDRNRAAIFMDLAELHDRQLKDTEQAIELYRQARNAASASSATRATLRIMDIRLAQDRPDEAVQEIEQWLDHMGIEQLKGSWWPAYAREAHARALAAAGRIDEAIAKYNEALNLDSIHPRVKRSIEEALDRLKGDSGKSGD